MRWDGFCHYHLSDNKIACTGHPRSDWIASHGWIKASPSPKISRRSLLSSVFERACSRTPENLSRTLAGSCPSPFLPSTHDSTRHSHQHVMRVFENNCTFNYSWRNVSIANWRKYCAWNTQSTHVIAVDTLSRSVDPASGIVRPLRSHPLLSPQLTPPAPLRTSHHL